MFCKSCGKHISNRAKFCEFCGTPLTDEIAPRRKNGTPFLTIVLVALLTAFLLSALCTLVFFAYMRFIEPSTEFPFESQATLPTQIHIEPTTLPFESQATLPTQIHTEPTTQAFDEIHPFLDIASPLFPDSSDRYLTADDLMPLIDGELIIARCEILARYGVIFNDPDIAYYFEQQDWYAGSVAQDNFDAAFLNDFETGNIQLIEIYEKILGGGYEPSTNNPYLAYYDPSLEVLLPHSSNTRLTTQDLFGLNHEQLIILRNQIIALHGYTFGDQLLMEYFLQCSWYHPSTPPGRNDLVKGMTSLEYENMEFIYQYEKNRVDLNNLDHTLNYTVSCNEFSITLPAYWKTTAKVIKHTDGSRNRFCFCVKISNQTGFGGDLFYLDLIPADEVEKWMAGNSVIEGLLISDTGEQFCLVSSRPPYGYVQQLDYNDPYIREFYAIMVNEEARILATITGINGYTYTPYY